MTHHGHLLAPGMTLLEVLSRYRRTEEVFRSYEQQAGVCLLCQALFDTLVEVAAKYGLDLERMLEDLEAVARRPG